MIGCGLMVAACASHPSNVLLPTAATAKGAATVNMLVMSTRSRSSAPGEIYDGERAEGRSLLNLVVSVPQDGVRRIGEIQWPRSQQPDAQHEFATLAINDIAPEQVDKWFLNVAAKRRKVLVFVHGFNNSFEEAAYRLAQIVHDSGTDAAPILFTWPSRDRPFEYLYDKESATNSRDALEYLLARAASDPNVSDITILAHSMGNWIAVEALRQIAIRHGAVPSKIKNVVMAAPDLDVDVFRSEYSQLGEPKPRFTIFLSQDDNALSLSRLLAGDKDRLGGIDPDMEPYRSKLSASNIVVIDLTKLASNDPFHHGKFADSPEVVRLIGARLIEGQAISGKDVSPGERLISSARMNAAATARK
ncbi:alpha/beta hydrolase [Methylocella silvestris]|uniref:alpha/beta hydrolase n=1 Tax=Methylocella silvestris TaxID=199596 RepID=UPI0015E0D041|nr:alpha/beta hydrolase [Methylocella silvestris]